MASVNQKYLTDENGQKFSPITSSESVYGKGGGQISKYEPYVLFKDKTVMFGDKDIVSIPTNIDKVAVTVKWTSPSTGELGSSVIWVDTYSPPATNSRTGAYIPQSDTGFCEIELTLTSAKMLRASWIGWWDNFSSYRGSFNNDNRFYVSQVIGFDFI